MAGPPAVPPTRESWPNVGKRDLFIYGIIPFIYLRNYPLYLFTELSTFIYLRNYPLYLFIAGVSHERGRKRRIGSNEYFSLSWVSESASASENEPRMGPLQWRRHEG